MENLSKKNYANLKDEKVNNLQIHIQEFTNTNIVKYVFSQARTQNIFQT